MREQFVGVDTGSDDWTVEIVAVKQADGSILVVSEHRYKTTIDAVMEEQEAGRKRQLLATGVGGQTLRD